MIKMNDTTKYRILENHIKIYNIELEFNNNYLKACDDDERQDIYNEIEVTKRIIFALEFLKSQFEKYENENLINFETIKNLRS